MTAEARHHARDREVPVTLALERFLLQARVPPHDMECPVVYAALEGDEHLVPLPILLQSREEKYVLSIEHI